MKYKFGRHGGKPGGKLALLTKLPESPDLQLFINTFCPLAKQVYISKVRFGKQDYQVRGIALSCLAAGNNMQILSPAEDVHQPSDKLSFIMLATILRLWQ